MRTPLTTRTTFINVVLSFKDVLSEDIRITYMPKLKQWCDDNMSQYGFILHDKDVLDNGSPKTNHIHLCGTSKKRLRLNTYISALSDFLDVSPFAITIEKMEDFSASLRYLIHDAEPTKWQYQDVEIITNIPNKELRLYLDYEQHSSFGLQALKEAIKKAYTRTELMELIGLGQYHFYHREIDDIAWEMGKDWFRTRT